MSLVLALPSDSVAFLTHFPGMHCRRHVYQHPTITPDADQTVALQTLAVLRDIADGVRGNRERALMYRHYPESLKKQAMAAAVRDAGGHTPPGHPTTEDRREPAPPPATREKDTGCFARLSAGCAWFVVAPLVGLGRISLWSVQAALYTLEWFVDKNHKWRVKMVDRALLVLLVIGCVPVILSLRAACDYSSSVISMQPSLPCYWDAWELQCPVCIS